MPFTVGAFFLIKGLVNVTILSKVIIGAGTREMLRTAYATSFFLCAAVFGDMSTLHTYLALG